MKSVISQTLEWIAIQQSVDVLCFLRSFSEIVTLDPVDTSMVVDESCCLKVHK